MSTQEDLDAELPASAIPSQANLAKVANRRRKKLRPKHPVNLDFDVDGSNIPPGFLKVDVRRKSRRHLLFMSDTQKKFLKKAKNWYADGTFKVVKSPFYQLWSIHAFIEKNGNIKQVLGLKLLIMLPWTVFLGPCYTMYY